MNDVDFLPLREWAVKVTKTVLKGQRKDPTSNSISISVDDASLAR